MAARLDSLHEAKAGIRAASRRTPAEESVFRPGGLRQTESRQISRGYHGPAGCNDANQDLKRSGGRRGVGCSIATGDFPRVSHVGQVVRGSRSGVRTRAWLVAPFPMPAFPVNCRAQKRRLTPFVAKFRLSVAFPVMTCGVGSTDPLFLFSGDHDFINCKP
jgi:hypothetical protein